MTNLAKSAGLGALLLCFACLPACNEMDDCPAAAAVVPDAACSSNSLQCAYSFQSLSVACDGTSTTYMSSCTCTSGTWACPSAVSCPGVSADAGVDAGSTPDASTSG